MSKILEAIKNEFGYGVTFTAYDLHKITGINQKVLSMNLKKYANNEVLVFFPSRDSFYLRTDEEILDAKKKANDIIDKYQLSNKKYKI